MPQAIAKLKAGIGLLLLICGQGVARAAPSGLNAIPTADLYDPGTLSLEFQSDGEGRVFGRGCDQFLFTQLALKPRVEIGADKCLSNGTEPVFFNLKWRLQESKGKCPAIALGVQNLAKDAVAQPYLVAGWRFDRPTRAHLGVISLEGQPEGLVGLDFTWKKLTLQADWVSGPEGITGLGLSFALRPNLTVTYAAFLPNQQSGPTAHAFNVQHLVRLW